MYSVHGLSPAPPLLLERWTMADVKCSEEIKAVATALLKELVSEFCDDGISEWRFDHLRIPIEHALVQQRMKGAVKTLDAVKVSINKVERILNGE